MLKVSEKQLYITLFALIVLAVFTCIRRAPTGDDAWFAEQSYWLLKEGKIRSEYFRGLVGWENQILVSHKLFLYFGAFIISIFGYQLPAPQFVGTIFFVVFLFEITFYLKKRNASNWYMLAMFVLIFSNRLIVKMSFENRPEMMLAALGFGSFLLIQTENKKDWKALLAGILAGAAMLCHLNGVIYLIGGFVTLLLIKNHRQMLLFSSSGGVTALCYWLDVINARNGFAIWKYQFTNDPATQKAFSIGSKLLQILTYPRLFFYSPEQVALSLLLLFLLWSQRRLLRRLPVFLRTYSLVILISFCLLTKSNTALYQVLFIPFMLVLVYELYRLKPFSNFGLKLVLAVYFTIGIFGMIQIIQKNFSNEYLPVSYKKLRSRIESDKVGFVPLPFFYNEYEQYPRLLTHENYKLQSKNIDMSAEKMARWAYQNGAGFMVLDYRFRPEYFYPTEGVKTIPFYKLSSFDGRFAIYKRY